MAFVGGMSLSGWNNFPPVALKRAAGCRQQESEVCMARKQDSPEVASEKALAVAEYESEQRRTLSRLARLREERLQREAVSRSPVKQKKRAV